MLTELLLDLLSGLIGDMVGEKVRKRRAANRVQRLMVKFRAGRQIRLACAARSSREDHGAWKHGHLVLSQGSGQWYPRLSRNPEVSFDRRTAAAQFARRADRTDVVGRRRRRVILAYEVEGRGIEFGLREDDLLVLGRVVNLPSMKL